MAAVFLKQPALALAPEETSALAESVCAVADYHGLDLGAAAGPIGLYVSLAATLAAIYVPRAKVLAGIRKANAPRAVRPATVEDLAAAHGVTNFDADVSFTQGGAPVQTPGA